MPVPEIEFVDPGPDPGPDEELDTGPRRPGWAGRQASPRTKRIVRTAAATIAAVIVGLMIGGFLHHDGGGAAAPPDAAVRLDVQPASAPASTSAGPSSAFPAIDVTCPVVDACAVVTALPAAVGDALRARLPAISGVAGTSVLVVGPQPTVRTRRVTARAGRLVLAVEIHPATRYDHRRSAGLDAGRERLVYARALTRGLAVTVSFTGPPGQVPGLATVRSLARDARLLAVG